MVRYDRCAVHDHWNLLDGLVSGLKLPLHEIKAVAVSAGAVTRLTRLLSFRDVIST